jgi:hypothetical protein
MRLSLGWQRDRAVTDHGGIHHRNQLIDREYGSSPPSENQRLSVRFGKASG